MNLNSPLFDRIRVRPAAEETARRDDPVCEHPGCAGLGLHRAPKGRGQEGQYFRFCLEHVRAYNQSYNYFAGMSEDAVAAYQKDSVIGHRPTWKMGVNGTARMRSAAYARADDEAEVVDPFDFFAGAREAQGAARRAEPVRRLSAPAAQALDTLGLEEVADAAAIKARYKQLVKRFHPDANGGDRSFEARLQEIIRAYNTLKTVGLC
ncbi:DnaJ domain [Chelatococcus sambhunathii]|uniref:DnaJ domain n=1 Tax=Chelatococcus sambhunathii TaxID=363953 RepID=A0ABM9U6Z1_9HYPH|nr:MULTISPECIES: DnaJ domain-containing protein [Chelatococcus]CUA89015.1 DnaJ domain [Chelatococcus sambhunathii]